VAASRRPGSLRQRLERAAIGAARQVLAWERAKNTRVELTFLGPLAMRRLNRRATGRQSLTDVIAFALPQPDGSVLGDVYLCPHAAARWVKNGGRGKGEEGRVRDELVRLAVHGTLHVLGYDHPDGPGRMRSRMWRKQEGYVARLLAQPR
jgi:probable rRNA maturation factor